MKDYRVPTRNGNSGHSGRGWSRRPWYGAGALAVMTVVITGFLAHHSVTRPPEGSMNTPDAVERDVLCRGGSWGVEGSEAILIVASATCDSCQADIPFEENLWRTAKAPALPVYYILAGRNSNRDRNLGDSVEWTHCNSH
jgi:hypothetical protein